MIPHMLRGLFAILLVAACVACGGGGSSRSSTPPPAPPPPPPPPPQFGLGPADCVAGEADGYGCAGIDLLKHVELPTLGAFAAANDIWGWTDPADNTNYALVGLDNGVAFVGLADPRAPAVLGHLPTATTNSTWRDIKVAQDHAYIVADAVGAHGMQVFDLTRLRGSAGGETFQADVIYGDFGSAHNLAINEDTNFAYVVDSDTCDGGLHMVDLATPNNPLFAGCHDADPHIHDAQCVTYSGPDPDHAGREICFNASDGYVSIVDVTDKSAPFNIANLVYPGLQFVHQLWTTEDHRYLFIGDELDEFRDNTSTRTIVANIDDLDNPAFLYANEAATPSIDHNLYVAGQNLYQANYSSGLRILSFGDLATNTLTEEAWFDTHPEDDGVDFDGAWSVYPFFDDGTLIVSDTERGLFVLSR